MREWSVDDKRVYLEQYPLALAKISRCYLLSAKNADKSEKYKREMSEAILLRDFIEDDIGKIADQVESEVLAQKYLCGKTLEETAVLLNYSKRQVERIHVSALEHLMPSYVS